MTHPPTLQSLPDIEERIELLKTTLGLFAPSEPVPIAGELRELAEQILLHWMIGRGLAPVDEGTNAPRLRALAGQTRDHDPALALAEEPADAILRNHDLIVAEPDHPETVARLLAVATASGDLYALVAPLVVSKAQNSGRRGARLLAALLALAATLGLAMPSVAEDVSTRYRGLTLVGNLELASGKGPEDGVALIVHGLLAHDRMETIAGLQKNLTARGLSTLAITLSLGQDGRTGFFDCGKLHAYRPYDSLNEIDAWIGWLKNNGATDITLIGHSQGGNQVAVYGIERRDPSVNGLVLLAPATFDFAGVADAYKARYDADLSALLDKARGLVQAGQGVERIENIGFLNCPNATATADSIVGWYTPSPLRDTPTILPRVQVRTLVVVAGADEVVPDLAAAVAPLVRPASRGRGEITIRTVEESDHFFRDLYNDDAADLIAGWIKG